MQLDIERDRSFGPTDFPIGATVEFVMPMVTDRSTLSRMTHYQMKPLTEIQLNTPYEVLEMRGGIAVLLQEGNARMFDEISLPVSVLNQARMELARGLQRVALDDQREENNMPKLRENKGQTRSLVMDEAKAANELVRIARLLAT